MTPSRSSSVSSSRSAISARSHHNAILSKFNWTYITSFATDILDRIEGVWEEMGLLEPERSLQYENLQKEIENIFSKKLQDELSLKDEYIALVESLNHDIVHLRFVLDIQTEDAELDDKEKPLMMKLSVLRKKHDSLVALKNQRLEMISPLKDRIKSLNNLLGRKADVKEDSQFELEDSERVTEELLNILRKEVIELENVKANREKDIKTVAMDVKDLIEELHFEDLTEVDLMALMFSSSNEGTEPNNMKLTIEVIENLSKRATTLVNEKKARTEVLRKLGAQIKPLWDLLEVSESCRQRFFDSNKGLGLQVIDRCEKELSSLLNQKKEKLKQIILTQRDEISDLFKKLCFSKSQVDQEISSYSFLKFLKSSVSSTDNEKADLFNEILFDKQEEYLASLKSQYGCWEPIQEHYQRYLELCNERETYEELIKDSSRLLDRKRGISQLRDEEVQRKRVTKTLPSLIEKLKIEIKDYEKKYGEIMVYDNVSMFRQIEANEETHELERERQREVKKMGRSGASVASSTPTKPKAAKMVMPPNVTQTPHRDDTKFDDAERLLLSANLKKSMDKLKAQRGATRLINDENINRTNF